MMEKFQQRFVDEAKDYCDRLELNLMNLEQNFDNPALIGEVFRIMHSLKGSGAMFGFVLLSEITHDLESLYELVRDGELALNSKIVGFTLRCVDVFRNLLTIEITDDKEVQVAQLKEEISKLLQSGDVSEEFSISNQIRSGVDPENRNRNYYIYFEPSEDVMENGTNPLYLVDELNALGDCRIDANMDKVPSLDLFVAEKCYTSWRAVLSTSADISEIEDVFLFVQDSSTIRIEEIPIPDIMQKTVLLDEFFKGDVDAVLQKIKNQNSLSGEIKEPQKELVPVADDNSLATIRVSSSKIDEYMNLVSEMITAQSRLSNLAEKRGDKDIAALSEHFNKLIRQMRDNAFDMSLIPLYNVATRFKRLVRDLSSDLNKEVVLETNGLETEVDKNIIEKLVDPMMHIIRNCIDHGIETPAERIAAGKPAFGKISISASYVGTFVQIVIEDDGAGLDIERLRKKAIDKGMLSGEEQANDTSVIQLIFEPGISTSNSVTDVSGRGVGMDAARKIIRDLRGDIEVETKVGQGTCFAIRLPLTLSIIDGLLAKVNDDFYIVPTSNIEKIYPLGANEAKSGLRNVVVFEGKEIPYLNLRSEFDKQSKSLPHQYLIAVRYEKYIFGLVVDDVLREYQAVVKPMGKMLKNHDIFLGASILGDGKVALVLDTKKIIQKFSA